MTYGQLREMLGIPPKALTLTNNKKLQDNQLIEGEIRVNVEDIGWYEASYNNQEASFIRAQRNEGMYTAGYNRGISYDEIIDLLKK